MSAQSFSARLLQFAVMITGCLALLSACSMEPTESVEASDKPIAPYTMKTVSYVPTLHDEAHLMDIYIPKKATKPMPASV